MPQASVKRLIEVEKDNLINLVLDIDKYPTFIPYCINSKVYSQTTNIGWSNINTDNSSYYFCHS